METIERARGAEAEFTQNLKDGIESAVNEMIARGEIQDYSAKAQEAALHAAITAIQKAQDFTDRVGPFYSTDRVRQILGTKQPVSRQAISDRVKNHRLLRVRTSDGKHLFPAFQFEGDGVNPELVKVMQPLLNAGTDGWTVVYWLTTPLPQFDGQTPLALIKNGVVDEVVALANTDAAAWSPHA
ncbi:MAG: DUF2384 domain-containing protein [Ancrocorticia sp.]